jgi:HEAT repeat protein
MPTEMEIQVLEVLNAIEIPSGAAREIESWGNEAVTVVCEAALGTYPGLRSKVRYNAVSLLGKMDHPQAREAVPLLINDPDPDVAIRAMRAAGRQNSAEGVGRLGEILRRENAPPLLAAEAVKALSAIDSSQARTALEEYTGASPNALPHRGSPAVQAVLQRVKR